MNSTPITWNNIFINFYSINVILINLCAQYERKFKIQIHWVAKNFFKILRSPFLYNAYKEFFEFIEVVPRFATYSNPSLSTRVSIKSLSLSLVSVQQSWWRVSDEEEEEEKEAYTRIYPVNWSKIKAETITGGGDPLPTSLSLFLSSTHKGSLERGRKKVTACVTFFAQPLFLSPPLWIAKSTGGSTPLSFSPGN